MKSTLFILTVAFTISLACIASSAIIARPLVTNAITAQDCQYETRPLINGQCDNSDPACPETLKDPVLHGDCPAEVKQSTVSVTAIVAPKTAPSCIQ